MEGRKMYEGILKVREQQLAWAEQAAKQMAKLTQRELDLVCHDSKFVEFRTCMQGTNGPNIVIEFMNVIAQTIIEIEQSLVRIDDQGEIQVAGALIADFEPGLVLHVWTEGWFRWEMDLQASLEERCPDVHSGIATMLIALGYALHEATPEVWGSLKIERRISSDAEKRVFLCFEALRWSYLVRKEDAFCLNASRDPQHDLEICNVCRGIKTEEDIRSSARCICPESEPATTSQPG